MIAQPAECWHPQDTWLFTSGCWCRRNESQQHYVCSHASGQRSSRSYCSIGIVAASAVALVDDDKREIKRVIEFDSVFAIGFCACFCAGFEIRQRSIHAWERVFACKPLSKQPSYQQSKHT